MFRKTWFAVLWMILAAASTCAQQFPSIAGRQQDLDFVANQIPARHPNFFYQSDRATFQHAAADLHARLAGATDAEFYVGLAALVAMAGDAHTSINLTNAPFPFFPLRFRWFQDGVFVTRASAAYSEALGTQLVRVGDTPVEEVLRRVAAVIPHENEAWLREVTPAYLVNQMVLQGLGLVPAGESSPLSFRSLGGREFTLQVDTAPAALMVAVSADQGPTPLYQQDASANYWYSYSAANRLLYFRYNSCANIPGNPFIAFAADLLTTLDNNPVDTFVFDIRSNSGGDSSIVAPLFNGLSGRFSRLSANPRFRIYDVFNGGTFSSGLLNAEDLLIPYPQSIPNPSRNVNLSTRVISIGQATGGRPSHYGNPTAFRLPGSGIQGQYSTRFFAAPNGIPDGVSLVPGIPVTLYATDYFARHDPVMAMILGRGSGVPAAPSGDVITVNAASFRSEQPVAPGSFAAAFGNFPMVPDEVVVSGMSAALLSTALLSTAGSQVNFIMPDAVPLGTATVGVRAGGKEIASGTVTVSRSGPAIFVTQPADPSQPGAILNQDGTPNGNANPAGSGSIVQIFATGYGGQPVQVYFAGQPAEVIFSGPLSQFAGLWQVNARIPAALTGQVSGFFFSDTLPSNGVTLWVR